MVARTKNQSFQLIAGASWRVSVGAKSYCRQNSIIEQMLQIHYKLGFSL
jgi:hypothetical protein